jgi:superfamily II DNA/RNA helicase
MTTFTSARPQSDSTGAGRSERPRAGSQRRTPADRTTQPAPARREAGAPADQPRRRRRSGRGRGGSLPNSPLTNSALATGSASGPATGQAPRPTQAPRAAAPRRSTRPAGPASPTVVTPTLPNTEPALTASTSSGFAELGVPTPLLPVLTALGAPSPFPIQAATLPATLAGRDVLGRGKTGSGKTIAFAIPLVARLTGGRRVPGRPRGLVLLPTRELALQVARTVEPLAKAAGLRTVVVFGGVGYGNQTAALRNGVDIVIACPGRLEDLVNQRACDLSGIEVTVLDEADHMADLGFLPVVRRLLRATPRGGQRLLFSATLDNGISVLVKEFLTDPILHAVDDETSPVEAMEHHIFAVDSGNRAQVIRELAQGGGRRLLFTRTKHSAKKWAAVLTKNGIPAVDLHGNLSQNARERNLAAFSAGSAKVLVATDIAARGIHVDGIELVVHLDPPTEHKAYLHRSGRTARAGAGGTVITVMLPDQRDDLRKLMKQAGITAATVQVAPGHPAIARLAG